MKLDFAKLENKLEQISAVRSIGRVNKIIGLIIEAEGLAVKLGELCLIKTKKDTLNAEVVGFKDNITLLMPLGEMINIEMGAEVIPQGEELTIKVGPRMQGRVLDALGNPLDSDFKIRAHHKMPQWSSSPHPLKRNKIDESIHFGIRAIDGFLRCGMGQRMGIFAGSGVGKSTLMGMIARNANADINVIALVGERGREVKEFIEESLGEEGLKKSIVIVATGDQPSLLRIKAALFAHSIAEYFRDVEGKNVLLMLDSITRVALAQREVGLAIGEPPATRGYTPSVFGLLPRLLERSGTGDNGSITALYTVLVEGDDMNEPVSDTVRGVLDGHIVLSRDLAHKNHFPAIDVLASVSRVMNNITDKEHVRLASDLRSLMATYREAQDLINIGAYQAGSNPEIDKAIAANSKINSILKQGTDEYTNYEDLLAMIKGEL